MMAYIVRRLLLMIPPLFGIMLLSFLIIQAAPGGPIEQILARLDGTEIDATARISNNSQNESGSGNHLYGTLGPAQVDSPFGPALDFDPATLSPLKCDAALYSDASTYIAIIRPDDLSTSRPVIARWDDSSANLREFLLELREGNKVRVNTGAGATSESLDLIPTPVAGWYAVAAVREGQSIRGVANNVEGAATLSLTPVAQSSIPLLVGGAKVVGGTNPAYYDGRVAFVGKWGRALSPEEIQAIIIAYSCKI